MTTLAELFEREGSDTVSHRGRIVKALVRIPVRDGDEVVVTRRQVTAARPQAIKLSVDQGVLDVNGHRAPVVALWSTTSPDEVVLWVRGERAQTIEVWNAWSLGGVDTAWIGNAGIVTRVTASGTVLRCSDGVGQAEFTDLEVEIAIRRS